jgi:hypothetical protein
MLKLEVDDERKEGSYIVDGCEERLVMFNVDCTVDEACTAEGVRHRLQATSFGVRGVGLEMLRSDLF